MKTSVLVLLLAGLVLPFEAGCKRTPPPSPTVKAVDSPEAKACSTAKTMEECSTCCTADHNSRFMGGKCECLQR
jgi:hypothetical protein